MTKFDYTNKRYSSSKWLGTTHSTVMIYICRGPNNFYIFYDVVTESRIFIKSIVWLFICGVGVTCWYRSPDYVIISILSFNLATSWLTLIFFIFYRLYRLIYVLKIHPNTKLNSYINQKLYSCNVLLMKLLLSLRINMPYLMLTAFIKYLPNFNNFVIITPYCNSVNKVTRKNKLLKVLLYNDKLAGSGK